MASQQDDTVFDQDLDDDDESSQSQDDDDDLENDDVLVENDDVLIDEEDEEDLNSVSPSTSSPAAVPIAVPSSSVVTVAVPNSGGGGGNHPRTATTTSTSASDPKRQRLSTETAATTTLLIHQEEKKPPQFDESRRLFQRLWTDEDEIELLQGFLDYTTQRGSNHHDTALFYDQIKSKLQLDFNKNQLVEKLRRLKKKYRNVLNKIDSGKDFSFKSPHDQATFEISRKIWSSTGKIAGGGVEDGNLDDEEGHPNPNFIDGEVRIEDQKSTPRSRKRSRPRSSAGGGGGVKIDDKRLLNDGFMGNSDMNNTTTNNNNNSNSNVNVSSVIEETVRSCLSPLFKELLSNAMAGGSCNGRGIGGLAMNAMPLSFGGGEMMVDEKWRKQHILELEVYSKRLELVQDQIRAQLEELRSMGE